MKKTLIYAALACTFVASLFTACSDEDDKGLSRLFMPEFLPNSYDIQGTSIKYMWRKTAYTTSYAIELSDHADFSQIVASGETRDANYTFTGLSYKTDYWARVKAVPANAATGESKWSVADKVTTLAREIPNLLYEVAGEDIEMKAVTVRWNTNMLEKFPVDRLILTRTDNGGTIHTIDLTPEQSLAGSIRIEELERNTSYSVTLYNMQAPEGNQHYNTRIFKTAGAPDGAVSVEQHDDLYAMILEAMSDNTSDAVTFYLTAGADYYMMDIENMERDPETSALKPIAGKVFASPKITKSITFVAEPGERPTLYIKTGKWDFPAAETTIDKIEINGVNIKEYISGDFPANKSSYFFNIAARSANLTIGELTIRNSDIDLPGSLWLANNANSGGAITRIGKFTIDGCVCTSSPTGAAFGLFQGSAAGSDIFNDVTITNSTFYGNPVLRGLFHRPTANVVTENGSIRIENCTFYYYASLSTSTPTRGSGFPLIDLQSFSRNLNVTVSRCLFANQIAGIVRLHASNNGAFVHESNYYTTDSAGNNGNGSVTQNLKGHIDNLMSTGLSSTELFTDPDNGDFTIMDKSSTVYTQKIGDPRWIK
ncbi:DUF5123 domain-containing protein [Alistipes provencensis]|uniref:DUF5123 domain-containing protein n=1 Tax=Alistipes provencensis TaxID=1816676 RepID=UPI0007ED48C4|nr:DUF5123 domain-containing protein [Alistipes provencensis]